MKNVSLVSTAINVNHANVPPPIQPTTLLTLVVSTPTLQNLSACVNQVILDCDVRNVLMVTMVIQPRRAEVVNVASVMEILTSL